MFEKKDKKLTFIEIMCVLFYLVFIVAVIGGSLWFGYLKMMFFIKFIGM